ncbi:hypothetical protein GJAV_G00260060 [Gymnothorax javanicus]|nr:hypothetical protein GJAV_G00260060 [Gymnothorax javanicus]
MLETDPNYRLVCLNDYVVTVNCVLNISIENDGNHSYWLQFQGNSQTKFSSNIKKCTKVNQMGLYCCTLKSTERFIDTEYFAIAFCNNKNAATQCEEMNESYQPKHHVKPMSPINLKVSWSSGHYRFVWDSGYETYLSRTFMKRLRYSLQYYMDGHPAEAKTIHSSNKTQQISDFHFVQAVDYIARVRSSPGQSFYRGEWSEWSSAVRWRTNVSPDATPSAKAMLLLIGSCSFLLCLLLGILGFHRFHQTDRMKLYSSVPSPAPYFQLLYSNYNGDFLEWLVCDRKLREPFTMEQTLRMETLIGATSVADKEQFLPPPSIGPYINVCGQARHVQLETQLPPSIQRPCMKAFGSGSAGQTATIGHTGCGDLMNSPARGIKPLHELQGICCSDDYCTLNDTHQNTGLNEGSPGSEVPVY